MGDLAGKTAIVTGAGQGIGEGIAKIFATAGAKIVVATRTAKNGQQTVDDITGQTIVVDGGSTLPESQVVMEGFYD